MLIRVALAEDSFIVREGIEQLLATIPTVEHVTSCADRDAILQAVEDHHPDVVLTDIRMPPNGTDEGIQVAAQLRETHPEVGVVVLSHFTEPAYAIRLLEGGSEGRAYLLKDRVHDRVELANAIEAVADGRSVIDSKVVEALVARQGQQENSALSELTQRESEVLAAIAEGWSNSAIADSLVLTKRAVEKHINSIFLKLDLTHSAGVDDVSKRVKAALMFLAGEVPLEQPASALARPEASDG